MDKTKLKLTHINCDLSVQCQLEPVKGEEKWHQYESERNKRPKQKHYFLPKCRECLSYRLYNKEKQLKREVYQKLLVKKKSSFRRQGSI